MAPKMRVKVRFLGEEIEEGGSEMIVREENSAAHKAWSGGTSPSFKRAMAFHLRYSKERSKRERVVVNSREEIEALQDWLSQNKLSFILDNIRRAGVRSLLDLVELSEKIAKLLLCGKLGVIIARYRGFIA
jgi:hypothetical protein